MESIGIVLNTIAATMRTEGLLEQSQLLTRELQSQQEELKKTNDRLEMQARSLRKSEEMLKSQQEELRRANEELQEKAQLLSNEKKQVEAKNLEIEMAKSALEEKAEQLALTSKYKSEFLANMSHELRTPLNSLLILSKLLSENPDGNLTEKQMEFARTIYAAGSDLLSLINDILDLSKIESGTVTLDVAEVPFLSLRQHMERTFGQVADDKGLKFSIEFSEDLPRSIKTDEKRLQQVVMNLLSNAFKFTTEGEVKLAVRPVTEGWAGVHPELVKAKRALAISVSDTGIGIPEDKQRIIFEAFQQADGTTSRKYGGTGLGLSISREIMRLLGGEIHVASAPGKGSTFTLYLPLDSGPSATGTASAADAPARRPIDGTANGEARTAGFALLGPMTVKDDRDSIRPGDPVVLIAEEDPNLAGFLLDLVRDNGFKGAVSTTGAPTLSLAKRFCPDAITLNVGTSDVEGLALLDLLKHDPQTRHIPVQVIADESQRRCALDLGAFGFTPKPVNREELARAFDRLKRFAERRERRLLLVDGDKVQRRRIADLIGDDEVQVETASSLDEAVGLLTKQEFDCVVVNPAPTEAAIGDLIEGIRSHDRPRAIPVVVHTAVGGIDQERLRQLTEIAVVRQARTIGELIDETALFLHRMVASLPEEKRQILNRFRQKDPTLRGKTVLIIDDDIRNVFSLTGALEQHGIEVVYAENGRDGIALLEGTPDIDLALIDIMMPEMDGFETMQEIRRRRDLKSMPLIAITAKAMKGDRQKCIEAGASDYIAKPVDIDLLLSLIRVWLHRRPSRPEAGNGALPEAGREADGAIDHGTIS